MSSAEYNPAQRVGSRPNIDQNEFDSLVEEAIKIGDLIQVFQKWKVEECNQSSFVENRSNTSNHGTRSAGTQNNSNSSEIPAHREIADRLEKSKLEGLLSKYKENQILKDKNAFRDSLQSGLVSNNKTIMKTMSSINKFTLIKNFDEQIQVLHKPDISEPIAVVKDAVD